MSKADYIAAYGDNAPRKATRFGNGTIEDFDTTWSVAKDGGFVCTNKLRADVLYAQEGRCYVCGVEEWRTKKRLHMHRVTPGKRGGTYTLENVVGVCHKCHVIVEGGSRAAIEAVKRQGGVK